MSKFDKQTSIFDVELSKEDFVEIPEGYERIMLSELDDGIEIEGEPQMTSVQAITFDEDGEEVTKHRCQLFLFDHDNEEYTVINLNLKKEGDEQTNIRKGSVLFDFVTSIMELERIGSTQGKNNIKRVNLATFRDWINNLDVVKIKVIEKSGDFVFNSFRVIDVE